MTILKPNKSPTDPISYRHISLLFNLLKILEKLILTSITPHIPLSPAQHDFRAHHYTTTLVATLTQHIHEGMNTPKPAHRTLSATIDISKAFDPVSRTLLMQKIYNINIDIYHKRWLTHFLTGRHAHTEHKGKPSTTRRYTNGIQQGSVLSPSLYNIYMHDIPLPSHQIHTNTHHTLVPRIHYTTTVTVNNTLIPYTNTSTTLGVSYGQRYNVQATH